MMPVASEAQTFTETFDAGIPSTWTKVDNHAIAPFPPDSSAVPWVLNMDEALGNYTNGTPSAAATASSFNHPGQYDVSLITPTFVLNSGANGRNVAYDINFSASTRSRRSIPTSASMADRGS